MEVWDDLWFWGCFSQRVQKGKKDRKFEWNENKFFAHQFSDKRLEIEIKRKSAAFCKILERK
jgi:hypothetical protein